MHEFHKLILREYDIRGIVGETLSEKDAYYLGRSFATYTEGNKVAVGYDGRLSSPRLEKELVKGLVDSGVEVIRIGLGPTPMLYFAVCHLKLDGGVMITGSHNPPTHNGFKCLTSKETLYGDAIKKLGKISESGNFKEGRGVIKDYKIEDDYIAELTRVALFGKDLKIAWDAGSGATGDVLKKITEIIKGEHILLNAEIDGNFPIHHPDPSEPKNMEQLIKEVIKHNCDLGIAFDGDGDRIGVVDNKGSIVSPDQFLILYTRELAKVHPKATVIVDIKTSNRVLKEIEKANAIPLMWKSGHSLIKAKMKETGALLAGEMSGHIFFADEYYGYDDALYAAIRLIRILMKEQNHLNEIIDQLPKAHSTSEIRIDLSDEKKFMVIEDIKRELVKEGKSFNDIDGVRVERIDSWWLLRASNTQAAIVMCAEAENQHILAALIKEIEYYLSKVGVKLPHIKM